MNTEKRWTNKLAWLPAAIILAILLELFNYVHTMNDNLTDFKIKMEHRLTVLEERINGEAPQIRNFDGYAWETRKAEDTSNGYVRMGIRIDVLYDGIQWSCGSSTEIVRNGVEADLAPIIKGYGAQTRDARAIIAVGMSSMEGTDRIEQENLARNRIRTLLNSFRTNVGQRDLPLYGYWLGQYIGGSGTCHTTGDKTAVQRRVVLIKVLSWDETISQNKSRARTKHKQNLNRQG